MLPVYRTADAERDPVFARCPTEFLALQWHADTFALPDGAVRLARSDAYEQQAFVVNRAYGVQFHIEVGTRLAAEWGEVPAYAESLEALMGEGAMPRLLDQVAAAQDEMTSLARTLFGRVARARRRRTGPNRAGAHAGLNRGAASAPPAVHNPPKPPFLQDFGEISAGEALMSPRRGRRQGFGDSRTPPGHVLGPKPRPPTDSTGK